MEAQRLALVYEREGRFFVADYHPQHRLRYARSDLDPSDRDLGLLVFEALDRYRAASLSASGADEPGPFQAELRSLPEAARVSSMATFARTARAVMVADVDGAMHEVCALDRTRDPWDWVGTDKFVTLWPPVYPAALGAGVRRGIAHSNLTDLRSRLRRRRLAIRERLWGREEIN